MHKSASCKSTPATTRIRSVRQGHAKTENGGCAGGQLWSVDHYQSLPSAERLLVDGDHSSILVKSDCQCRHLWFISNNWMIYPYRNGRTNYKCSVIDCVHVANCRVLWCQYCPGGTLTRQRLVVGTMTDEGTLKQIMEMRWEVFLWKRFERWFE